ISAIFIFYKIYEFIGRLNQQSLPDWFDHETLRVGPAKFEYANINLNHWFDGLAMIYKFEVINGELYFSNKFLRSQQYYSSIKGKMTEDEFGTRAPSKIRRLVSIIKTLLGIKIERPSCNVNILNINKKYLATSEVTRLIEFNKNNLDTISEFKFKDSIKGQFSCAHPQIDLKTGVQYNFVVDISRTCKYTLYKISKNQESR
ncbi:hypothetical protein EGW08_023866, partial [Elysia chlorotica]